MEKKDVDIENKDIPDLTVDIVNFRSFSTWGRLLSELEMSSGYKR